MSNVKLDIYPDLIGHENVKSLSYSPDGKYLVSGSKDTTIKIWDVNKLKEIKKL